MHPMNTDVAADTVAAWIQPAVQVAVTVAVAVVVLMIGRWLITRTLRSVVEGGRRLRRGAYAIADRTGMPVRPEDEVIAARRVQRATTLASVSRSVLGVVVTLGVITVLANIFQWNLGPVLASAGILGVALGFGAQSLVKDVLSGIFMLIEDQYGVGDVVDLGPASGTVEEVGLRITRVRDITGTLWFVRNGEILRVGNSTQGWSRAIVDVTVAPGEAATRGTEALRTVAAAAVDDPDIGPHLLAPPDVLAYDAMTAESVTLRLMVKVAPAQQWAIQRLLRARITAAFAEAGIGFALPRREIVVEREG